MRTLIVCESMFGNTRCIAEAVGEALSGYTDVDVVEAGSAPPTIGSEVELLLVGGPTHAFGMSRPGTRQSAIKQGASQPAERGVREWLANLASPSAAIAAAAFDTRVDRPRLPGSAARAVGRRLGRLGFTMVAPPTSFWVDGTAGPVLPGEIERAHQWGHALGATVRAMRQGTVNGR